MIFDQETYEWIERYLLGELPEIERQQFEERLQSDANFAEEVEILSALYGHFEDRPVENPAADDFIASGKVDDFKKNLENTLRQYKQGEANISSTDTVERPKAKVRKIGRIVPLSIAAALILLLGVLLWMENNGSASPGELYADYGTHEPLALVQKSDNSEEHIASIEKAFNEGDYKTTLSLLSPVLDTISTNHPYSFSLKWSKGTSLLETGKYAEAEAIFNELKQSNSIDAPKADWYLVLTYLKQGNKEKTVSLINEYLEKSRTYKQKEMKAILAALN